MLKKCGRSFVSLLLVFLLVTSVFTVAGSAAVTINPNTLSFDNGKTITFASASGTTSTNSDSSVTVSDSDKSVAITINTKTNTSRKLNMTAKIPTGYIMHFDYEVEQADGIKTQAIKFTPQGSTSQTTMTIADGNHYILVCATGTSGATQTSTFNFEVTGKQQVFKAQLKNIALVKTENVGLTVTAPFNGSVTVGEDTVSADDGDEDLELSDVSTDSGATIVATPADGYVFAGFSINGSEAVIAPTGSTYTYFPTADGDTVEAIFVAASEPTILVGNMNGFVIVDNLRDAISQANEYNYHYIIPITDVTVEDDGLDYDLPSDVTLVVPNNGDRNIYTVEPCVLYSAASGVYRTKNPDKLVTLSEIGATKPYVTLTLDEGVTLNALSGSSISVGGIQWSPSGGGAASVRGGYGLIKIADGAKLNVEDGASLYAWGYIISETPADEDSEPAIECASGAKIYEMFQIADHPGGTNAVSLVDADTFVFSQYYVQNIECKMRLDAGAEEIVFGALTISGAPQSTSLTFIGSSGALFTLSEGVAIKYYDYANDKLVCRLDEGAVAEINPMSLSVGPVDLDTSNFQLPISNIGVEIAGGSSVTINQDLQLYPDSYVTLDSDSELTIQSNIYVADTATTAGHVMGNKSVVPLVYSATRDYQADGVFNGSGASTRKASTLEEPYVVNDGTITIEPYERDEETTVGSLNIVGDGATISGSGSIVNNAAGIVSAEELKLADFSVSPASGTTEEPDTQCDDIDAAGEAYIYDADREIWHTESVTVSFIDDDDPDNTSEITANYAEEITAPTLTKSGFTLTWVNEEDENDTLDPGATIEALSYKIYRAVWVENTASTYTVTWKNEDGTILETDTDVAEGTTPSYDGATPTKTATAEHSYTFAGWSPEVSAVTGDITYTAIYTESLRNYTVTWQYEDGTEIEIDNNVDYGTMPSCEAIPTKEADAQYTYSFSGWTPEVTTVTGDVTYTAVFSSTLNRYTVTFKDEDGTVLQSSEVDYGTTPEFVGALPTKAATDQYTYTFSGWSPAITAVTGDQTYTAHYTSTVNTYTVTWKNEDGMVLKTDERVPYGTTPNYEGPTPTKEATAEFTYTFSGWSPAIESVTGDVTYTATYSNTTNSYTVTWKNGDTVLEKDENVAYGTTPTFDGDTPTKEKTLEYTYTFTGWDPEISSVTGDVTYTAQFTENEAGTITVYAVDAIGWDNISINYWIGDKAETGTIDMIALRSAPSTFTAEIPETVDGIAFVSDGAWTDDITTGIVDGAKWVICSKNNAVDVHPAETFYLVGTMNEWTPGDELVFTPNQTDDGKEEYMLTTALNAGDSFKVKSGSDVWYPEGMDSNYIVNTAGTYNIYFRPNGDGNYDWYYGVIFIENVTAYTITWVDGNGNTLKTDTVAYGATPSYNGETPTKAADAQYTYTFNDTWQPEITPATADATYTAQFDETLNTYTVTWVNYDGTVLETDEDVEYGATPSYDSAAPTRPSSESTVYTFTGWTPEVAPVTGNVTYTATFGDEDRYYNVTFKNEDGIILSTQSVKYGEIPVYSGETPTKASDAQYDYIFDTWDPALTAVTGDQEYTAVYTSILRYYTITWQNEDGTLIDTAEVAYGETPTHADPTKQGDAQYTYTFSGWTPEITAVTGEATYKASFTATVNKYLITFVDEDGTELQSSEVEYGSIPVFIGTEPTKAATAQYTYTFKGWDNEIVPVTGEATYKATYTSTVNKYLITFVDEDGTELQSSEVAYGDAPTYTGETPTKGATAQYTYTFAGWDIPIVSVTGEATYKATYTSTVNKYLIKFVNDDDTELQSGEVAYGDTPVYNGPTPTKEATAQYTYIFAGWDTDIEAVTGEATYKATYSSTVNKYAIKFVDEDGTELQSSEVEYGSMPVFNGTEPTKAATAQYSYTFAGWDPEIESVTGDKTYTAQFTETVRKYTITFLADDFEDHVLQSTEVEYGQVPVYTGDTTPTKESTAQDSFTFAGWSTDGETVIDPLPAVTGDETYKPAFTATLNTYTITWNNWDGTELEKDENVPFGTDPSYDGAAPTKEATAQYTYTFDGWDPTVESVGGDRIYTAKFTETVNKYTVKFVNDDGTELQSSEVEYGETPVYNGPTPTKEGDAEFTYSFNGWDAEIVPVTGEAIYKATYTNATNTYTITWLDEDGSELRKDENVAYGTIPSYGATPTKEADAQYTYTFAGWTPVIAPVTGDATYQATYTSTVNKYTIQFVNEDGTELQSSEVEYGTIPSFDGETPTKASTAQYTYTFAGWDTEIESVTGDKTYTATYTSTVNEYTITWIDGNSDTLKTEQVAYGETPAYTGETPTKDATAQYTYTFNNTWTPEITSVTGDATYTAQFDQTVNEYTITWKNGDDILKTEQVAYGTTPAYDGATPTKDSTESTDYTFSGWDPELAPVTGDATYTAQFAESARKYTITWKNGDTTLKTEEVAYGEIPAYDGEIPTKEGDDQYTYFFTGWTPAVAPVTGDATYSAVYGNTTNTYTITWLDEDGTELKKENVDYGTIPSYGENPTKEADAQYTYTFAGWSPLVAPVTGDATYQATYTSTVNKYTIQFVDEDGTELQSGEVEYGTIPSFDGETPTKASTAQYTYTFAGWDTEIESVTGDKTYTATYTSTVNEYTITWIDGNGDTLKTEQVAYGETPAYTGETPTKDATAQYTYTFNNTWTPEITSVTGDATYTAQFDQTVNEYTITWKNGDDILKTEQVAYGTTPSYDGATPTKAPDADRNYTFSGWDPEVEAVTGDKTYTATFTASDRTYTVTWMNGDTVLETDTDVARGTVPSYDGETPTKAFDGQNFYVFSGWDTEPTAVTDDVTYSAKYLAYAKPMRSLTLEGKIMVNFYWALPDGENPDDYICTFRFANKSFDVPLGEPVSAPQNAVGRYKIGFPVDAPDMTQTITAELRKGDVVIATSAYKAADYAKNLSSMYSAPVTEFNDGIPYLVGKINGADRWDLDGYAYEFTQSGDEYVVRNVALTAGDEIRAYVKGSDSSDTVDITESGVYNIFFDESDNSLSAVTVTAGSTDVLPSLLQATLNYGAKAQLFFNNNTGDLADSTSYLSAKGIFGEVTQDMINDRLGDDNTKEIDENIFAASGLKYHGASLVTNDSTKIKLYFDVTDAAAFEAAKDSFAITDLDQNMEFSVDRVNSSQVCFSIDGVAPANLEKRYVLTNGSADFDYAALDYVSKCLDKEADDFDAGLYDLTQALYWYNVYADAYFG